MTIESGNTYQTRNGNIAIIETEHINETLWVFSGKCFDKNGNFDRIAYWTKSGIYNVQHKSNFDIVKELI